MYLKKERNSNRQTKEENMIKAAMATSSQENGQRHEQWPKICKENKVNSSNIVCLIKIIKG